MADSSDIPREYHSDYEDRPFQSCTRCGESLADMLRGYQIVKLWHNGETTYEYAICDVCHHALTNEMSVESRQRLEEYYHQRLELTMGRNCCASCQTPASEIPSGDFSRSALFQGGNLEHEILICGLCTREMHALLSEKTRGVWDRFVKEHFPAPPPDAVLDPSTLIML